MEKPKAKGLNYTIITTLHTPRGFTNFDDYMEELREMKGIVTVEEMD